MINVRLSRALVLATALGATAVRGADVAPAPEHVDFFEQEVRPLLVRECYECHSAQSKILQGGLHLDSRPGWQKGGDSGEVIVPGNPDESLLVRAVRYEKDEFVQMPPKGKLSDVDIAVLAKWVKLGAPDPRLEAPKVTAKREINIEEGKKYWAFQPLDKAPPPTVQDASWCRTPVDRFIQAKLEEAKIAANPEVNPRALARRAYFDLIGLPPTPEEVEAFVDSFSPSSTREWERGREGENAYERLIDDLLASPHFGERWGRHWLDLARFAESHGYEQDYDRPNAYHYRDFVIDAFNRDLPFDTFVKWQLAGDEYEPKNPMALKATGFLAAGPHATQITANQAEKERYDELDDMARTVGTTMLGLTIGCARCHDHKFDPITNIDYYRIVSTFTTTVRSDLDVNLDPEAYERSLAEWDQKRQPLVASLIEYEQKALRPRFDEWLQESASSVEPPPWTVLDDAKATAADGVTFTNRDDGTISAQGGAPLRMTYNVTAERPQAPIRAVRLEALRDFSQPDGGPGLSSGGGFRVVKLSVTIAPLDKNDESKPIVVKIARRMTTTGTEGSDAEESDKADSWIVESATGRDESAIFEFAKPIGFPGGSKVTIQINFGPNYDGIGTFRLAVAEGDATPSLADGAISASARRALATLQASDAKSLKGAERDALFAWYRTQDADWHRLSDEVSAVAGQHPHIPIAKVLMCSEGVPAVRLHTQGPDFYEKTFVLRRGDPNQKVEEATSGFVQVLVRSTDDEKRWQTAPPEDCKTSYRRRALAEWMTDVDHGAGALLARVIVNRLWYYHLGKGLVDTPSDFGVQGGKPTHPELLDYLAGELIRNGWRLKPIHKLIMTSAVYRQTTAGDAARRKVDVANNLLWHRPLRRLEGEIIRDAMLAVAGSLDETMFGPGTLKSDMRRRSIYFFVKRSKLVPMMTLFDGPDTLQDLSVRPRTTVAPQALLLMNNETVRDFAAEFAKRIVPPSPGDLEQGIAHGYLSALGRPPDDVELRGSVEFVRAQLAAYRSEGKSAEADLAAWTDFCQVLFQLNEFIYVE